MEASYCGRPYGDGDGHHGPAYCRQQRLVAEVIAFRSTLDRVALLNLPPEAGTGEGVTPEFMLGNDYA